MLAAVAMAKRTCFPTLCTGEQLKVTDLYHPGLSPKARIYNSLTMDGTDKNRRHVLLTGPNRGGKSTLLKSLGCAVLMAQTVGIVFARSATIPVFDHIITALSPQDVIGKLSLFEAEIEFAKEVKSRLGEGTMFLMMDEIFHGTNAHDGVEASQVFLDDLYASKAPVFSVVSTHYMDLPGRYGATSSQNLCMEASVDPSDPDRLIYSYRLCEGVNRFSSVREILRERGLLAPCVKPPEKTTEEASKV
jgi:DNA mismatch repair ATPase MutS